MEVDDAAANIMSQLQLAVKETMVAPIQEETAAAESSMMTSPTLTKKIRPALFSLPSFRMNKSGLSNRSSRTRSREKSPNASMSKKHKLLGGIAPLDPIEKDMRLERWQ